MLGDGITAAVHFPGHFQASKPQTMQKGVFFHIAVFFTSFLKLIKKKKSGEKEQYMFVVFLIKNNESLSRFFIFIVPDPPDF